MVESLIGTLQAPMLAGEAWLVFETGQGTTPCLTGDTPTHVFARHGVREFLRRLALSLCLASMLFEQPGLDKDRTRRLLDQDENQRLANGLLTSISTIRSLSPWAR